MDNIENIEDIIELALSPVFNSGGSIEILIFFDYHCKDSKNMFKVVKSLVKSRSEVRVVLKALPVRGDLSLYATQVGHAVLIAEPHKYVGYFETLMVIDEYDYSIHEVLTMNKIYIEKVRKILKIYKPRIDDLIKRNMELAEKHKVVDTPSFIIGDELLKGIVSFEELHKRVQAIKNSQRQ